MKNNGDKKTAVSAVSKKKAAAAEKAHAKNPVKAPKETVDALTVTKAAGVAIYPEHVQKLLDKANAKAAQKNTDIADLSGILPTTL